jgi:hypothetical protein
MENSRIRWSWGSSVPGFQGNAHDDDDDILLMRVWMDEEKKFKTHQSERLHIIIIIMNHLSFRALLPQVKKEPGRNI